MKEKVHVENAEENPVVRRILENVHKGHGVIAEPVHQYSLEFSLYVVKEHHKDSQLLIQCVFRLLAVDFLLENYQQESNQNRAKVLNQKHSSPAHLRA